MGSATILLLVAAAAAALPPVSLEGPAEIMVPVRRSLQRERPELAVVPAGEEAVLELRIAREGEEWVARISSRGETIEVRPLGSDLAAAARLATLILLETVEETDWSAPPPPVLTATTTTATTATVATIATIATATRTVERPATERPRWGVEAGGALVGWGRPGAVRLGGAAAAHYRILDWAAVGLRVVAAGACCRVIGQNLEADTLLVAGLIEGRASLALGPLELWLLLSGGVGWERVTATVVDLFAGPAAPERRSLAGAIGRAGGGAGVELTESFGLWTSAGVQLHSRALRISPPPPYSDGREPLERTLVVPFFELGLGARFF